MTDPMVNPDSASPNIDPADIEKNKTMAGLAYLIFSCLYWPAPIQNMGGIMQTRPYCCLSWVSGKPNPLFDSGNRMGTVAGIGICGFGFRHHGTC